MLPTQFHLDEKSAFVELIPWVGQTEELVYLGNHSVELTWAPSYPSILHI
jgi:hypothetical protein